jgi:hypothetical protein
MMYIINNQALRRDFAAAHVAMRKVAWYGLRGLAAGGVLHRLGHALFLSAIKLLASIRGQMNATKRTL